MKPCDEALKHWGHVDTLALEARAHGYCDVEIGDDGTGGVEAILKGDNRTLRAKGATVEALVKKIQEVLHGR